MTPLTMYGLAISLGMLGIMVDGTRPSDREKWKESMY